MAGFNRNDRYDRQYNRYDRAYSREGRGYDREYGGDYGRYGTPFPGARGYPTARFGWGPIGWAGLGPDLGYGTLYGAPWYGYGGWNEPPRRRPDESPAYGRGGDRELRDWGRRYGYDFEYTIRPRRRGPR